MKLQNLLDQLHKEIGGASLKVDENGGCTLVFDDKLEICLEPATTNTTIHMYAVLCPIPQNRDEKLALYELLMEGHLFGYGSSDATFGASPRLGNVVFFRNFSLETITFKEFMAQLQSFVNTYETWKKRLASRLAA